MADGPRLIGAVDPVERVLVALPQIKRAGADRVVRSAGHTEPALQLRHVLFQLRLSLQHFCGRIPIRPFLFAMNHGQARPAEALAADTDPVADRLPATLHQIEEMTARIDNDCAGRRGRGIGDHASRKGRIGFARRRRCRGACGQCKEHKSTHAARDGSAVVRNFCVPRPHAQGQS
jgi:hypothetical protein